MRRRAWISSCYLVITNLSLVTGHVCVFYKYVAECQHKVDGVSMAHITATINHCNYPVDVNFHLESETPTVQWSYTFTNDNEIQTIPGYDVNVQMHVFLRIVEENKLWIRVDFDVDGLPKTFFIDEKVELRNVESCVQLNVAGKIAIGCLVVLLIIAGVLLVILIMIRRQRREEEQRQTAIIEHMETNEQSGTVPETLQGTGDQYSSMERNGSTGPVVRFALPVIPEQNESSSDSGRVSIDMACTLGESHLHIIDGGALPS